MNNAGNETVLAQERLHWGIFILPLLAIFALFLLTLPVMVIFHSMHSMVSQFNPQTRRPIRGFFVLILVLPQVLVGLPLLLATWVAYLKSNITLTDRRLIFRMGLLARVTGELPLQNVEAIFVTEPLFGRFLGYGTVLVTSLGGLHFPFSFALYRFTTGLPCNAAMGCGQRQIINQTRWQARNSAAGRRFPLHAQRMKTRIHRAEEVGSSRPEAFRLNRLLAQTAAKRDEFVALLTAFLGPRHERRIVV